MRLGQLLFSALFLLPLFAAPTVGAQTETTATAASRSEPAERRSFDQVRAAGTLRVGVDLMIPYAMKGKDGALVGSDIDVANRVAKDLGIKAEFKVYAWDQLIPALQRGEIDIISAGLSVTPERALLVYFSNPFASSGISIATNTKLTAKFESLDALDDPTVAIGVVGGTVSEQLARQLFERASIKVFTQESQAEDALVKGLLHAYVRSEPAPRLLALRHPKEVDVPLSKPLLATREAFAVRRGDNDFINFLNAWIVAREADAWLASTRKYWFESVGWQDRVAP